MKRNDNCSDLPDEIFDPWLFWACSVCVLGFLAVLAWALVGHLVW